MKHKNMKIEINAEQPLDDVVRELERLEYIHIHDDCEVIYTSCMGNTYGTNKDEILKGIYEPTTLQQLREMK